MVVAGSGVLADRIDAFLNGKEPSWLSWEALRGVLLLSGALLGVLALAGAALGLVLLGLVLAL